MTTHRKLEIHMPRRALRYLVAATAIALAASACGPQPVTSPSGPLVGLKVGLGYIPSVQFAPFYRAQQAGYYANAIPHLA